MSIYVGDVGTIFSATIRDQDGEPLDLTGATVLLFVFIRPSGESDGRTAVVSDDATSGVIEYEAEADLLTDAGAWAWQAYVEVPAGKWSTTPAKFTVHPLIF